MGPPARQRPPTPSREKAYFAAGDSYPRRRPLSPVSVTARSCFRVNPSAQWDRRSRVSRDLRFRGSSYRWWHARFLEPVPLSAFMAGLPQSPKPERAARALRTTAFIFSAVDGSLSGCHALSCLAARGGRLHRPDDAQAERREVDVRRRAAAFVGHRAAGLPRTRSPTRDVAGHSLVAIGIAGSGTGWTTKARASTTGRANLGGMKSQPASHAAGTPLSPQPGRTSQRAAARRCRRRARRASTVLRLRIDARRPARANDRDVAIGHADPAFPPAMRSSAAR